MAKRGFDAAAAESMTSVEIGAYLTERERRFAQAFNECLRGTEAAIRAGYSAGAANNSAAHRASTMLRDPRIQAYRLALIRESAEDMALSRDSLALRLVDVFNRCTEAVPVMAYDHQLKRQVPTGEYQFDDRINLTVAKGKKDAIQAHAETHGESVNGFINRAIDEAIERDNMPCDHENAPTRGANSAERKTREDA